MNAQDKKNTPLKKISLCGRPNVGKSTLFNRLIGKKKALVLDTPGVTRDVKIEKLQISHHDLELADLAGLEFEGESPLQKLATEAAMKYLNKCDLVLLVLDGRESLTSQDRDVITMVRRSGKQVLVVITKGENLRAVEGTLSEVNELGFGEALVTSSEHNQGIGELKEEILRRLKLEEIMPLPSDEEAIPEEEIKAITLGVYGRPNVGKSTLVNCLLREDRMIVSPVAGTTVDTIDSYFQYDEKTYRILDTAGIRRKSKTEQGVEVLSIVQAVASVERADVALFVLDGFEGVTDQDEKIAGLLVEKGRPVVIVVNKWDLCKVKREDYAKRVRESLPFLDFAPVLFVSCQRNEGLDQLFGLIDQILKERYFLAPTPDLNRVLKSCEKQSNPKGAKIFYSLQTSKNPPTITIKVNDKKKVHYSFERFLKNRLREHFGWMGSPLRIVFKEKN